MPVSESELQEQVAEYLCLQYPEVLFHSDFGSGVKLTPGQAMKQKRQNGGRRGWPDMLITETYCFTDEEDGVNDDGSARLIPVYHKIGLFLELKREGERLYPGPRAKKRYKSKDGKEYRFEHFMEQADCLYDLRQHGYCAEFAIGFDEAKKIIDEYLGGE